MPQFRYLAIVNAATMLPLKTALKRYLLVTILLFCVSPLHAQNRPHTNDTNSTDTLMAVVFKSKCGLGRSVAVIPASKAYKMQECTDLIIPVSNIPKLSPVLFDYFPDLRSTLAFTLLTNNVSLLAEKIANHKGVIIISLSKENNIIVIECSVKLLLEILKKQEVLFADIHFPAQTDAMISGYDRSLNKINLADKLFPEANGHNVTIGIRENNIDTSDIDVIKRVLPTNIGATTTDFHATSMATLAGGAGNSFYTGKGPAWKSRFFSSSFNTLYPDNSTVLSLNNVSVQNHSYGTVIQSFYGAEAVAYDQQLYNNPGLLHIFSSGNRGTESSTTGTYTAIPGYANITGNFKSAKNVITVAAIDTSGNIATFSSAGPLYDGRLAPQITALGPNGTSDAAALVSGSTAVLQQVYKDSNNQLMPDASLIKSILFCTSRDIGNPGIDYRSGYGSLDLHNALQCIMQRQYQSAEVAQSGTWNKNIFIPANIAQCRIVLNWTDSTAQVNNVRSLNNDLDLVLINTSTGIEYLPWTLSGYPSADSLNKPARRYRDSLNTTEIISVELPAAGNYQIIVKGTNVRTFAAQKFSVAFSFDTLQSLRFTSPSHEGDVASDEDDLFTIRWQTTITDPLLTGILSVSFDGGATWQIINSTVQVSRKAYEWQKPDTTAVSQLRMQTPGATYYSDRFYIAPLTKVNVDYLCADSFRLSWRFVSSANSYKLFALKDSPYLEMIFNTTDTFAVLQRSLIPYNVFAVQPQLLTAEAPRSIAVDIRSQGVECYYNTLLATADGNEIEVILQLSFPEDVDSISFQKVTSVGMVIRTLSTQQSAPGSDIYSTHDDAPASGANYYRAVIWINGSPVFTETVMVIHNGTTQILVFPNPVIRGQQIQMLIRQEEGEGTLQIIDVTGRVLDNIVTNGSVQIPTNLLPAGIYFYRFVTRSSEAVTGKFIIK